MKNPKEAKKLRAKLNPNLAHKKIENLGQKNEKGSVTLFVLIALIFFIIIGLAIFMTTMNQSSSQQKAVDKIADDYKNVSENELDKLYDDELNKETGSMILIVKDQQGKLYKSGSWINGTQADRLPLTVDVQWPDKIEDLNKQVELEYGKSIGNTESPSTQLQIFENKILKDGNEVVKVNIGGTDVESDPNDPSEIINGKPVLNVTNKDFTAMIRATATYLKPGETEPTSTSRFVNINIDRIAPEVTITQDKSYYDSENEDNVKVSFGIEDDISGISKVEYGWTNAENGEPELWTEVYNKNNDNNVKYSLTPNAENANDPLTFIGLPKKFLKVKVSDIAGNEHIETKELNVRMIVAKVIVGGEEIGQYYKIQDAIDVCPKDGTKAIVELIKCDDYEHKDNEDFIIEEAVDTYANQNIVLNLAGHTITNKNAEKPTINNNGTLQIVHFISNKTGEEANAELELEQYSSRITSLNSNAIVNNVDSTLTIGDDDDIVLSGPTVSNFIIQGNEIGIKNLGTFKYFDGNVTATKAIENNETEIAKPLDYSIVTTRAGGKETAYLGILSNYAARIGGIYYSTLQDAVDDAVEDDVIVLVSPNVVAGTVNVIATKDITIDLDGFNISDNLSSGYLINNKGKLKITSSKNENFGEIRSANVELVFNDTDAELTIEKISLILDKQGTKDVYKNAIYNKSILNIGEGANVRGNKLYNKGIYNTGTLNNSGTIYGYDLSVHNFGTFNNRGTTSNQMQNENDATTNNWNIIGGSNMNGGTLNVYDGKVEKSGSWAINISKSANIKLTGGEIFGIYNYARGDEALINIEVNGGVLRRTHVYGISAAFYDNYGANETNISVINSIVDQYIEVRGNAGYITIQGEDSSVNGVNLYSNIGDLNIESGTVYIPKVINNCNLLLGKNDGTISSTYPLILNGVEFSGNSFKFYDGKIVASSSYSEAIIGEFTEIAPDSELIYGKENNKETITLQPYQGPIAKIDKDNPAPGDPEYDTYDTLQSAINAYNGETSGIVFLRDCVLVENGSVPTNKEVKIDLNGKNITVLKEDFITNNGKLVLTDKQNAGTIWERSGTLFINNNEIDIKSGTYKCSREKASAIVNNKDLTIEGTTKIITTANYMKCINSSVESTVTMDGGTIQSATGRNVYGIYGYGEFTLNSGTITGGTVGVYIKDATLTQYDATISSSSIGIQLEIGTVNMEEGAVISGSSTGIYVADGLDKNKTRTINLNGTTNGGTINASYGINTLTSTTININKGTINATATGLNLDGGYGKITCNYNDCTLSSTGVYGVNMCGLVDFTMLDGSINDSSKSSDAYGINMITYTSGNIPNVVIKGGTISAIPGNSNRYGYGIKINRRVSGMKLTVGDNTNDVNIDTPIITGKTYGIFNEQGDEFNFYDGKIKGQSGDGSAIEGNITQWATGYEIIKDIDDNVETAYLSNDTKVAQIKTQVGNEIVITQYKTLREAFEDCHDNTETTVELLRNITIGDEHEITSTQNIILDLGGNSISSTSATNAFKNNGIFKIKDSLTGGVIENKNGTCLENNNDFQMLSGKMIMTINNGILIKNNATMVIGRTIAGETEEENILSPVIETSQTGVVCVRNMSTGTVDFLGGTMISSSSRNDSYNQTTAFENNGQLNLTRGKIQNMYIGVSNKDDATVDVYGTTFKNVVYAIQTKNGTVNVEDGVKIEADIGISALKDATKGTINLNGSTNGINIKAKTGIEVAESQTILNINNTTMEVTSCGITLNYGSTCNFNSGIITSTGEHGVYITGNVDFTMLSGEITVNRDWRATGIFSTTTSNNQTPNIVIKGGTITAISGDATIHPAYGIHLYPMHGSWMYNQTLTIGDNNNAVNSNSPVITGSTYGVYNQCQKDVYFYDGKVVGKNGSGSSIEGNITDFPVGYEVITSISDDVETAYLSNETPVARIGTTDYYSLSSAFGACPNSGAETIVELLKDIYLKDSIEITANQNIILDLNGKRVKTSSPTQIFTNNGTLKIKDSLSNGVIRVERGKLLVNNKTFELESGKILIRNSITAIINNDSMTIGKTVAGETQEQNEAFPIMDTGVSGATCIKNNTTGTLNMLGGKLTSSSTANDSYHVTIGFENSGELNLIRGRIDVLYIAVKNTEDATVNVYGTQIKNVPIGINTKNGTVNVEAGAVIEARSNAIITDDNIVNKGVINLNGTESNGIILKASYGIHAYEKKTTINVNYTTIEAKNIGIYIGYGSNCYFNSGKIISEENGVIVGGDSEFTMLSGEIFVKRNGIAYGITASSYSRSQVAKVNIKGGTITAISTSSNSKAYGINIPTSSGSVEINVGTQDKRASKNSPIITGTTYGIFNEGEKVFNFYDGTIRGNVLSFGGTITKVEDKYQISNEIQNETIDDLEYSLQSSYLALLPTDRVAAFVNGVYYDSLQQAITTAGTSAGIHVVLANGCVLTDNITINAGQDIVLDLNGYSVTRSANTYSIINNGKLTITDTSEEQTGSIDRSIITGSGTVQ